MLIHVSKKGTGSTLELSVDGSQVEQVHSFKFLGVTINSTLTWSEQINMVCAKVSHNLNLLRRLSWFLPQLLLLFCLKSSILPLFHYCDIVWSGCTKSEASRLEILLNYACRTVLRKRRGSSASAACGELVFPPWLADENYTLLLPCSTVCPPSPHMIFVSFFLCLHPTTTLALLCLAQTSTLINLPLAKSHSVSLAQHCDNPYHRTTGIPQLLLTLPATFYE